MGLDISVCKICKKKEAKVEYHYFRMIDDDGNYKNDFPAWTNAFLDEVTEEWYDWEKFKEESGIDVYSMEWYGEEYSERGCFMTLKYKDSDKTIEIDLEKVPKKNKTIKVLFYNEVGYQRKGLNGKFYDDYEEGKIGYFVWNLKELKRYKKDYCDRQHRYIYPNGEKSNDIVTPKKDFQHNIIDTFVEGECVVTFSW